VPQTPVALKVTGVRPVAVAVNVFTPAVVPSVQLESMARPAASVVCTGPAALPPPDARVKVTATPAMAFPKVSRTITRGAAASAVLTVADCPSPASFTISDAAPGLAVALNDARGPPAPAVAVRV
jgi:hypothetical protein